MRGVPVGSRRPAAIRAEVWAQAGSGCGDSVGRPRWVRTRCTTAGSWIVARRRNRPPQARQARTSNAQARRSSSAHEWCGWRPATAAPGRSRAKQEAAAPILCQSGRVRSGTLALNRAIRRSGRGLGRRRSRSHQEVGRTVSVRERRRRRRSDVAADPRVGREGAVVEQQVDPRPRHQGRELFDQLVGRQDDGAGAVAPCAAERQEDFAAGQGDDYVVKKTTTASGLGS